MFAKRLPSHRKTSGNKTLATVLHRFASQLLLVAGLIVGGSALAALTVDSIALGGGSSIAVTPGATIPVTMSVTNDATNNWN